MSSMLEQAIIDAAALREAALKNAEQSLIEKYAPQIKEAVEAMLESEEPKKMKYEGRVVSIVHEVDSDGNVTVSEAGGKPFVVSESDLSEMTSDDLLQEEEEALEATAPATDSITAPFAGNPSMDPSQDVELSLDVEKMEDFIEIDLGKLEDELSSADMPEEDKTSIDDMAGELDLGGDLDLGGEEEEEPEDEMLQELLNLLDESEMLEEEIEVDMKEDKDGTFRTDEGTLEYYQEMEEAKEAHEDEDEEEEKEEPSELQETIDLLSAQNERLEYVILELNDKLNQTLLSNAKLIYQNRTLADASLNERQKDKIVEAIAKAESPKEAKQLHETLTTTVGSDQKKGPQSLSESVNRRSNLSGMLNRGQNLNESKSDDSFVKKMQKLAGIK